MNIEWKTLEKDGEPQQHQLPGIKTPYITCIVWLANPKVIRGGIPAVTQWNVEKKEWNTSVLRDMTWFDNLQITHYIDNYESPEKRDN